MLLTHNKFSHENKLATQIKAEYAFICDVNLVSCLTQRYIRGHEILTVAYHPKAALTAQIKAGCVMFANLYIIVD